MLFLSEISSSVSELFKHALAASLTDEGVDVMPYGLPLSACVCNMNGLESIPHTRAHSSLPTRSSPTNPLPKKKIKRVNLAQSTQASKKLKSRQEAHSVCTHRPLRVERSANHERTGEAT